MYIKRNILFRLEQKRKNGIAITENIPIIINVTYAGKRNILSTGHRIDAEKWDNETQHVKRNCTNKLRVTAADINADLDRQRAIIETIFKRYELKGTVPSKEEIKNAFTEACRAKRTEEDTDEAKEIAPTKKELSILFWDVFDEFVKENGSINDWTYATYEKFAAVKNHLKEFNENLTFSDFNESGLTSYVEFLRDKKGLRNSTIGKQIGFLKWFLRWSHKKGHHDVIAYDTFKPKLKTTQKKVIFLTKEELAQLCDYEIPKDKVSLERIRDVFVFCCFSGIRYSDVFNLKRANVTDSSIQITTVKTADSLSIELNNITKSILDKYKNEKFPEDKALPVISNQKMNDRLKELCKLAGIDTPINITYYKGNQRIEEIHPKYELISTHAARRTFICSALAMNIPPQVVMKWTGHSDYKAMKPYIDIADEIKADAMKKFNNLI